jgi:hypothetical protein
LSAPAPGRRTPTLALVESPVQLLNVLEWAHAIGEGGAAKVVPPPRTAPDDQWLSIIILSPNDPMTRGQLRRMTEFALDEGVTVQWCEARSSKYALLGAALKLVPVLAAARRLVLGDPFSRLVQALLPLCRAACEIVVVDDGTATMEFVQLLERGEPLVRWHRSGGSPGFGAVFADNARRMLTPGRRRSVEVFSSMPVAAPDGLKITANRLAWTRSRFGPPIVGAGTDIVGTSLVETGVVDPDRYLDAVQTLTRTHQATRYFAHRRESVEKLHRITAETGLEIVRPDLPLELVARRGPIGHRIVSFPSTVVHTLPLALQGMDVEIIVCDVDPAWLTQNASPRAEGFLSGIADTARDLHKLSGVPAATP